MDLLVEIKKPGVTRARWCDGGPSSSEWLDVRRRRALGSLRHVERNLLRFLQRLVARHLDRAVVREEVLAAIIGRDEAEALGIVEPLDCTGCHYSSLTEF